MTITQKAIMSSSNLILPSDVAHLDRANLIEALRIADELERRRCADDPEYWLFRYAHTRDEHDPTVAAKPFPDKEYLHEIARFWLAHRMNLYGERNVSRSGMATP